MISKDWTAKLCDFSFAGNVDVAANMRYTYGTTEFMSPEIILSQPYGFATDVFSMGIVLCETITEKQPSDSFLCRNARDGFALNESELSCAVLPSCPTGFEALTLQCCQLDPVNRPAANQCVLEFELILDDMKNMNIALHTSDYHSQMQQGKTVNYNETEFDDDDDAELDNDDDDNDAEFEDVREMDEMYEASFITRNSYADNENTNKDSTR